MKHIVIVAALIGLPAMGQAQGASVDMGKVCANLRLQYNEPNMTITLPGNHDYLCWDDTDGRDPSYFAHMRNLGALRHWETSSADNDETEVNDSDE